MAGKAMPQQMGNHEMIAVFKIQRFDPEKDKEPYFQTFELEAEPEMRILDCLNQIKWTRDGTLAYRWSCGHGVCGSDAVRINGRCALACKRLLKHYDTNEFVIEPLPNFPVQKDLLVDLSKFYEVYHSMRPYLIAGAPPERERVQNPEDRKMLDEVIRCILCACCTAACPVTGENPDFVGPAAIVRAFRYIFDARDEDRPARLKALDRPNGVWACVNHFECTRVCPKDIRVTWSINRIKRELGNHK